MKPYPTITSYKQAVDEPASYATLEGVKISRKGRDLHFASGNFATVFKAEKNKKQYALKCFLSSREDREERYRAIARYLKGIDSPYFVSYKYLTNELWVDDAEYPVVWMEWVEGQTLGAYLKDLCAAQDTSKIRALGEKFKELALWLLDQELAHGDLKHDNILVKPTGDLVLVDYDGMYVPTLQGRTSAEVGGKGYQHPLRSGKDYHANLDDFSILVIYTTLLALEQDPSLLEKYEAGNNLIVAHADLENWASSGVCRDLRRLGLDLWADRLSEALQQQGIVLSGLLGWLQGIDVGCLRNISYRYYYQYLDHVDIDADNDTEGRYYYHYLNDMYLDIVSYHSYYQYLNSVEVSIEMYVCNKCYMQYLYHVDTDFNIDSYTRYKDYGIYLDDLDMGAGNYISLNQYSSQLNVSLTPTTLTFILPGNIPLELILVKAGSFMMGSPEDEEDRYDNEAQHKVTLTRDYYIGKYPITQAQWQAVMGENPSEFKGANLPVEKVSWDDIQVFLQKANGLLKAQGKLGLPTEAQWEYAARGGEKSKGYVYAGSNDVDEVAWCDGNSGIDTHVVGGRLPNGLDLYDMSGNVWEWCADWFGEYAAEATTNPLGPSSGSDRVLRGGSWLNGRQDCRAACRYLSNPGSRHFIYGFRVGFFPV